MHRTHRIHAIMVATLILAGGSHTSHGDFQRFVNSEQDLWFEAVGAWDTITFEGFENGTRITDQYAGLGVLFTDTDGDFISGPSFGGYPLDGWGLRGQFVTELSFEGPMRAFGTHFPGAIRIFLYQNDELVYQTPGASEASATGQAFAGYVTTDSWFDRVEIRGSTASDTINFDNIYFSTIPAPGAIAVLACAGLMRGARRRRG